MSKNIEKTDLTIDGQPVFILNYENGQQEYVIEALQGRNVFWKRIPKCKLDIRDDGSEVVSDVSLVLDVDLTYPTMLEQMARFEGLGQYDEDEDFTEIENELGEPISEYEERYQKAQQRLIEIRSGQSKQDDQKKDDVESDIIQDVKDNLKDNE